MIQLVTFEYRLPAPFCAVQKSVGSASFTVASGMPCRPRPAEWLYFPVPQDGIIDFIHQACKTVVEDVLKKATKSARLLQHSCTALPAALSAPAASAQT